MAEIRAKSTKWTARALRKIDNFPVNSLQTGKMSAERGSLRTASRTSQSFEVTEFGLRASHARRTAQFRAV
jgi:hypothetical protein